VVLDEVLLEKVGTLSQPFSDSSGSEELRRALESVPEDYALVLKLRFLDEMPLKRSRLFWARHCRQLSGACTREKKLLRAAMSDEFMGSSD